MDWRLPPVTISGRRVDLEIPFFSSVNHYHNRPMLARCWSMAAALKSSTSSDYNVPPKSLPGGI